VCTDGFDIRTGALDVIKDDGNGKVIISHLAEGSYFGN